jgi:hypothetical protein
MQMQHEQPSEQPPNDADDTDMSLSAADTDSEHSAIITNEGSRIVSAAMESRRREYRRQTSLTLQADTLEGETDGAVGDGEMNGRNNTHEMDIMSENIDDDNRSDDGDSGGDEWFGNDNVVHYEFINDSESESDGEVGHENNNNIGPLQPAKNHSYLPTAQPLYPEEWVSKGNRRHRMNGNVDEDNVDAYANEYSAGCEDNDSLSLHYNIPGPPGGRHCHSVTSCINIIDDEMSASAQRTALAILEMDDSIVLFPGAVLPLRLRDRRWVSYLGAQIDDARGLYGSHQGTMEGMGEVRLVILPRVPVGTRRTRRTPVEGRGRTGRWQVNLIRLGATGLRRHARRRHAPDSIENNSDARPAPSRTEGEEGGRTQDDIGVDGQRRDQPQEQLSSDGESDEDELFHPTHKALMPTDPLVGRIGTLATVVFTHEETTEANLGVGNPQRHNASPTVWKDRTGELVLTVLGTRRCRLIRSVKDDKQDRIPLYVIEEIYDGSAALPPSWMLQLPGNIRSPISTPAAETFLVKDDETIDHSETDLCSRGEMYNTGHNGAILKLSLRTFTPAIVYQALWPWRLCQKICDLIQNTAEFQGLRDILPSAAGLRCEFGSTIGASTTPFVGRLLIEVVDPSAFANWVAANMPLSVNGRLDLLEMVSTVQQLKYILKKIEAKRKETILRCKNCGSAISQMQHVFSVGGSDGTTGAYVNEYGVVHQTMTLRKVDGNVVCTGRPETRDSWFPGYSWQIAHCSICSAHLGWKFRMVSKSDDKDPDRSRSFWGFSSLTTDEHVKPRRVIFSPGRNIVALLQQYH